MLSRPWLLGVAVLYMAVCLLQVRCAPAQRPSEPMAFPPAHSAEAMIDLRDRPDGGARIGIPKTPGQDQKTPPCDEEMGEVSINGACYVELARTPPCGKLREHGGHCYRVLFKAPREPSSVTE